MMRPSAFAVLLLLAMPGASSAEDEVLQHVVVRNRLFSVKDRLEVTGSFGLVPVPRLVEHYDFTAGVAYNAFETFAFEVRGGYALSRHSGLATRIAQTFLARDPNAGAQQQVDDLSGLWQMGLNATAGVRWAPIYGKLSLMAELPVHFQAYVSAGAGMASLHRQSLVYCLSAYRDGTAATCSDWLTEDRASWLGTAAAGLRFFTRGYGGISAEVRDYLFPDQYRIDINRIAAEQGSPSQGTLVQRGLAQLVMVGVGYTFFF
jgi:outer membrane beta-barrel protein